MKQLRELTIMTPNKPGKLSQVLRTLPAAKVNLQAIDSSSGYDLNLVRLITSDATKTKRALEKLGYQVTETAVLAVTIIDQPGQLAKITSALGKAKVNIDYMYATAAANGAEALVVFHLSDSIAGEKALRAAGWQ
ncbi:MAG: ACT domain-containing protein [Verrucomicrobiota bacterium]